MPLHSGPFGESEADFVARLENGPDFIELSDNDFAKMSAWMHAHRPSLSDLAAGLPGRPVTPMEARRRKLKQIYEFNRLRRTQQRDSSHPPQPPISNESELAFVARIMNGPDLIELSDTDVAKLDAWLAGHPLTASEIASKARGQPETPSVARHGKLEQLRNYNAEFRANRSASDALQSHQAAEAAVTMSPAISIRQEAPSDSAEHGTPALPQEFSGGTIVFYCDRVELCGANICDGPRAAPRRIFLELLARKCNDGRFEAYSGAKLERELLARNAKRTASGLVRDLRNGIRIALREQKNIECKLRDVILSGDSGYRFADSLSVQYDESARITDITDIKSKDVPDRDDGNGGDDVGDQAGVQRRVWILEELRLGMQIRAAGIAAQFNCSLRTAERDLTVLKEAGQIEFVGSARKGNFKIRRRVNDEP